MPQVKKRKSPTVPTMEISDLNDNHRSDKRRAAELKKGSQSRGQTKEEWESKEEQVEGEGEEEHPLPLANRPKDKNWAGQRPYFAYRESRGFS